MVELKLPNNPYNEEVKITSRHLCFLVLNINCNTQQHQSFSSYFVSAVSTSFVVS